MFVGAVFTLQRVIETEQTRLHQMSKHLNYWNLIL